jgi:hypothetical protein
VTSGDSAPEFKADSGKFHLFIDESTSSFSFDKFVSAGDIAFDVTMKNSTGKSIVLLGIGIKVLKVSEVAMMPSGQWQTFKINTTERYVVNMPDIYGELGNKLNYSVTPQLIDYLRSCGAEPSAIERLVETANQFFACTARSVSWCRGPLFYVFCSFYRRQWHFRPGPRNLKQSR